jgi:RND family efflux transporter MFP subunit
MQISEEQLLPKPADRKHREDPPAAPRRKRSKWLLLLLILAVLLITGAMFFSGWRRHQQITDQVDAAAERQRDSAPEVNVAKVTRSPGDVSITLPGNIMPVTEAFIYARASGYVKKRNVDFGDRVTEGQLLAEIDSPELDNQVAQARSSLAQAESQATQTRAQLQNQQAQEDLAHVTWDRYRNLQARGAIARQDADQQETNFHTSEAAVRAAQASVGAADENVKASRSNLDRLISLQDYEKVRAPFAGVITARNFDIGALISAAGSSQGASISGSGAANATELFRLARFDVLRILVNVYQENALWIKAGQMGEVFVQEFPNRKFMGRITRTANSVDVASRTMLTEVQIPNPNLILLPGMYAQVKLSRTTAEPALLVPGDSIITTNHGLQVAVLQDLTQQDLTPQDQTSGKHPPGVRRIHFTNVQVGRDNGEQIEVTSGLQGWEYVVINPGDEVQEGAVVLPVTPAPKQGNRSNGKGSSPKK